MTRRCRISITSAIQFWGIERISDALADPAIDHLRAVITDDDAHPTHRLTADRIVLQGIGLSGLAADRVALARLVPNYEEALQLVAEEAARLLAGSPVVVADAEVDRQLGRHLEVVLEEVGGREEAVPGDRRHHSRRVHLRRAAG